MHLSGFQITKIDIIHFFKFYVQINLNQSLSFFVYESLENACLTLFPVSLP